MGKPDGVAAAVWILGHMSLHPKAILSQEPAVLRGIQTGVIQRLTFVRSNRFAITGPTGEHHDALRGGMLSERGEHPALIVMAQMEEAVPRQDAVEGVTQ